MLHELIKCIGRGKTPDDRAGGKLVYFAVARDRLGHTSKYVSVNVVPASLPYEFTTFFVESTNEVDPLHAYSIWPTLRRVS